MCAVPIEKLIKLRLDAFRVPIGQALGCFHLGRSEPPILWKRNRTASVPLGPIRVIRIRALSGGRVGASSRVPSRIQFSGSGGV
jgi:hypothetical protein